MQTFLPYPNFLQSAQCLDYRRLGKQRVECRQILQAIYFGNAWTSHPATIMWRGFEKALGLYWMTVCAEWEHRGYANYMGPEAERFVASIPGEAELPWWFGESQFHRAHRSNLLRKDPIHYGKFGWTEHPGLPYLWPLPGGGYKDAKMGAGRAPVRLRKRRG